MGHVLNGWNYSAFWFVLLVAGRGARPPRAWSPAPLVVSCHGGWEIVCERGDVLISNTDQEHEALALKHCDKFACHMLKTGKMWYVFILVHRICLLNLAIDYY